MDSGNKTPVDEDADMRSKIHLRLTRHQILLRLPKKLLNKQPTLLRLLALHLAIPKIWITRKLSAYMWECSEEIETQKKRARKSPASSNKKLKSKFFNS